MDIVKQKLAEKKKSKKERLKAKAQSKLEKSQGEDEDEDEDEGGSKNIKSAASLELLFAGDEDQEETGDYHMRELVLQNRQQEKKSKKQKK